LSPDKCQDPVTGYQQSVSDTAVVLIDMLNAYRHDDAELLVPNVADIIDQLANLIDAARQRDDVDLIYVNDNYGDFTADHDDIVRAALEGARPDLVKPIVPDEHCRFLTKVRHSAFYSTALAYLLGRLETKRLVLTGQVTEQCILYTALDAYVRHFPVVAPPDAVAHIDPDLGSAALKMMERNMSAEIIPAADCLG
jgi:nicotinamidase-related amidase